MAEIQPGCQPFAGGVVCGPGGAWIKSTWDCPECKVKGARRLVNEPNSPFWGIDWSCECGDRWQDGERAPRPFQPKWREKAKTRFESMWVTAAPEGTQARRDEDWWLIGLVLPDGTEISRDGTEAAS